MNKNKIEKNKFIKSKNKRRKEKIVNIKKYFFQSLKEMKNKNEVKHFSMKWIWKENENFISMESDFTSLIKMKGFTVPYHTLNG